MVRRTRSKHGPGYWLCWQCADEVTNHPRWENQWWIPLPDGYRSKGGKCARCERIVVAGERCAKVMVEAGDIFGVAPRVRLS